MNQTIFFLWRTHSFFERKLIFIFLIKIEISNVRFFFSFLYFRDLLFKFDFDTLDELPFADLLALSRKKLLPKARERTFKINIIFHFLNHIEISNFIFFHFFRTSDFFCNFDFDQLEDIVFTNLSVV